MSVPSTAGSRVLQETRGEPGALLDRCVLLAERVSTLEAALLFSAHWTDNPMDGGPCWCEGITEDGEHDEGCKYLRQALAGLGADPATQETAS